MEKNVLKLDNKHERKSFTCGDTEILKSKSLNKKDYDSEINYIINIQTNICKCKKKKLKKLKTLKKEVEPPQPNILEKMKKNTISDDRIPPKCHRCACCDSRKRQHLLKKKHGNSIKKNHSSKMIKKKRSKCERLELSAVDNLQDYYEDINSDESFSGSDADYIDKLICRTKQREEKACLSKINYSESVGDGGKLCGMRKSHRLSLEKNLKKDFFEESADKRIILLEEAVIKTEPLEERDIKTSPLSFTLSDESVVSKYNYDSEISDMDVSDKDSMSMDISSDRNSIHSIDTVVVPYYQYHQ